MKVLAEWDEDFFCEECDRTHLLSIEVTEDGRITGLCEFTDAVTDLALVVVD